MKRKLFYLLPHRWYILILLLCANQVIAQTTIKGKVTDKKGEALIGATVALKNTAIGTVTDVNGNFALNSPKNMTEKSIL
jgi:hypothetical protein